jgi:hypothetical protein
MPTSKHRRKPGGKAVAHPGRGKSWKSVLSWLDELEAQASTVGLPLFDWADNETAAVGDNSGPRKPHRLQLVPSIPGHIA